MYHKIKNCCLLVLQLLGLTACGQNDNFHQSTTFKKMNEQAKEGAHQLDTATFGAGCFWCTEAQFQQLKGVERVESGYMGGSVTNPTYKQVCTGTTGHAEVCNIYYDAAVISFDELLAAFWTSHDPTQLNRQGNDVGTQYRSAVFYHNDEQRKKTEEYKAKLNAERVFSGEVVTQVAPATTFYKAEVYHQNYFNENGSQPYCSFVVKPKVEKFRKVFKEKLK
jgi:peptide-methionine (S)-S-oxide reductase